MKVEDAYKRSIHTTLNWIQDTINPSKTQVFFCTYPLCISEVEIGTKVENVIWKQCQNRGPHLQFKIANSAILAHKNTSKVLNVTKMTSQRKDGHLCKYYLGPNATSNRQD
ncbi:putative PC-Esterase [Medicago truncatula]|uniref:Putative PC-Esterase n=1 Tax=Medicago truncatula TaxID=3880 RepID=A0A396J370_MEDTR|nr:putative PC-Esterase [Medicago truncatula]